MDNGFFSESNIHLCVRRQAQAQRPAFGARLQSGHGLRRQVQATGLVQQCVDLIGGKAQIGGAQLAQGIRRAQPRQRQVIGEEGQAASRLHGMGHSLAIKCEQLMRAA